MLHTCVSPPQAGNTLAPFPRDNTFFVTLSYEHEITQVIHQDQNPFMNKLLRLAMEFPAEYERLRQIAELTQQYAIEVCDAAFDSVDEAGVYPCQVVRFMYKTLMNDATCLFGGFFQHSLCVRALKSFIDAMPPPPSLC